MEGMAEYPDKFFDLAIVDPPYGIGAFWNGGDTTAQPKIKSLRQNERNWNSATPDKSYFLELKRISRNQIIWGWNFYTEYLGSSESLIFWFKNMGAPNYSNGEIAYTSFKHKIRYYRYDLALDNKNRTHPCQKPIALYQWLLENYAKPGDILVDTHVGSASSLIAFEALGFEYVAWEIDKDYYEAAKKRLENWRSLPLFDEKREIEQIKFDF